MTKTERFFQEYPFFKSFILLLRVHKLAAKNEQIAGIDFNKINTFFNEKILTPNIKMTDELLTKIKDKYNTGVINEN